MTRRIMMAGHALSSLRRLRRSEQQKALRSDRSAVIPLDGGTCRVAQTRVFTTFKASVAAVILGLRLVTVVGRSAVVVVSRPRDTCGEVGAIG